MSIAQEDIAKIPSNYGGRIVTHQQISNILKEIMEE
jgi:hypothetical protein